MLPAPLREALGVSPGDDLVAWAEGDRVVLCSRAGVLEGIWERVADVPGSMVDELIAERRAEAAAELAEESA